MRKRRMSFAVLVFMVGFVISATPLVLTSGGGIPKVCPRAVLAAEQVPIGPGILPDWYGDAQVQLGWIFDDPTIPQGTDPLPDWSISVGDIPVWDYDPDRIVWDAPGQWYIRIPNLNNDRPVKNFWISWVYDFDTYLPGLRSETSIEWFPDEGYDHYQYIDEWFDSEGNLTENFLEAAYARFTLSVDLYPNPEYEDIWLGTHGGIALAREVYILTLCARVGCDFEVQLSAGWNMVSFPCLPADATWDDVLGECGFHQVLTWDGTSYITPPNPEFGVGYWVLVLESCTVTITSGMPCESYERCLDPGWSMIGSIITCTIDADCVFPGFYQLLTWDGTSYVSATTIEPGKGYWALVLEETCIVVDESCCIP